MPEENKIYEEKVGSRTYHTRGAGADPEAAKRELEMRGAEKTYAANREGVDASDPEPSKENLGAWAAWERRRKDRAKRKASDQAAAFRPPPKPSPSPSPESK